MRALFAATAALLLSACAHPLEIRNLDRYSSLARGEPLERQTTVGLVTSAPDAETRRLVAGVGKALGRYSARVLQPYDPKAAPAEVVARISATPRYEGSGSNWFVNFPGLLVAAPAWNGYAYKVGYDIQILLTRGWDNAKLDAWSLPVSLDVRHSSGLLLSPDYNPEVTEPTVSQAGEVLADHVARDIVRRLNSEGRLWKLEPPPEFAAAVPPPSATEGPSIATTPLAPPVVAVPATPAPSPEPAPAIQARPAAPPELAPGATAQLRIGGVVRMRPLPAAEPVATTSPTVKLASRTRNSSGEWWFVAAGGKSGWVLATDLQAPASAAAPTAAVPATTLAPAPTPAPAPAPVQAPSSTPAAAAPAAPASWAAGQPARLRPGAAARVRMAADAEPAKGIDASQPVRLKSRVKRDTGVWWYVVAPGGAGWVLETELVSP